jgi:hypothetical protein
LAIVILAMLMSLACRVTNGDTLALSVDVRDASGQPVPGALFYAEAYVVNEGAFDFIFAVAGDEGKVPTDEAPPPTLRWRRGARLALAAFAPGMKPFAIHDHAGRLRADGITLTLQPLSGSGYRWEPRLGHLSFPFESQPALARRLAGADHAILRKAFLDAYEPLAAGEESAVPREWKKLQFLQKMTLTQ